MEVNLKILEDYDIYLQKIVDITNECSNEELVKKYLNSSEINKIFNMDNAIRVLRDSIYISKKISSAVFAETEKWNIEQKTFFLKSIEGEINNLLPVFRGFSHYMPESKLPIFGEGGLYGLVTGAEILHINYRIIDSYCLAIRPIFNRLDEKIKKELNPIFNEKNRQVDVLIEDLKLYKGEASARKTKEIYKQKYISYKKIVHVYEAFIIILIVVSLALVFAQLYVHQFFETLSLANVITIKITIIAIVATLFTYCFKQISFYRKISEQAHQTYMELEALPEYLTHLPEEKQNEIRADLAKRYFGQNLFESIKEDSASIQEQAKANAEVLKSTSALLDIIKKQSSSSN